GKGKRRGGGGREGGGKERGEKREAKKKKCFWSPGKRGFFGKKPGGGGPTLFLFMSGVESPHYRPRHSSSLSPRADQNACLAQAALEDIKRYLGLAPRRNSIGQQRKYALPRRGSSGPPARTRFETRDYDTANKHA